MNKLSNEEKERLKKMNDTFLYNVGYEHVNNICNETDRLLEEYKDIEVPDSLNQWFIDYSKELERTEKQRKTRKKVLKYSKRIAAVLIIISITGSVMVMSVEAFRVRFFDMVIETFQKFSLVSQEELHENNLTNKLPCEWSDYYYPIYLPEGFSVVNTRELNDTKYMTFSNLNGTEIRFIQGSLISRLQIDSENSKIIEVEIQGNKGILVVKEDVSILNWANHDMSFSIHGNVEESVLLAIAESLQKNN